MPSPPLPRFRRPGEPPRPPAGLPPTLPVRAELSLRVRRLAAPFLARQGWILGFCAAGALQSLYDLVRGNWASLVLDATIVAALVSLWRAMWAFRQTAVTGQALPLARATAHLVKYVRFTVVLGFGTLTLMAVLTGVLVWVLSHGGMGPAALQAWAHG